MVCLQSCFLFFSILPFGHSCSLLSHIIDLLAIEFWDAKGELVTIRTAGDKFVTESLVALCKQGARLVRLDAFGYMTKKLDTPCFFQARNPQSWLLTPHLGETLPTPEAVSCNILTKSNLSAGLTQYTRKGQHLIPFMNWPSQPLKVLVQEPEVWDFLEKVNNLTQDYGTRSGSPPTFGTRNFAQLILLWLFAHSDLPSCECMLWSVNYMPDALTSFDV